MRNLLMLGLMLWGSAGAVMLYTVTVKTSPEYQANQMDLSTLSGTRRKLISSKSGTIVTFKIPAGKYAVWSLQPPGYLQQYVPNSVNFTVNKNLTVIIPVTTYPHMDEGGKAAFDRLIIDMTGTVISCPTATIASLCATVGLPAHNVQLHAGIVDGLTQIMPWQDGPNGYGAEFRVGSLAYTMRILQGSDEFSSVVKFTRK